MKKIEQYQFLSSCLICCKNTLFFHDLKLKLESTIRSPQQNGIINLKAVGPLSCLHLEKNEHSKAHVSRLNRNCFFG